MRRRAHFTNHPVATRSSLAPPGRFAAVLMIVVAGAGSAACHGRLVDLEDRGPFDAAPTVGLDAGPLDLSATQPPVVAYRASIHDDLVGLGCAVASSCHRAPGAKARLQINPTPTSDADWQTEFQTVRPLTARGSSSELLTYPLSGSGVMHSGDKKFTSDQDPTYQKWLSWIRACAPFTPSGQGAPDAGVPCDASAK